MARGETERTTENMGVGEDSLEEVVGGGGGPRD